MKESNEARVVPGARPPHQHPAPLTGHIVPILFIQALSDIM